MANVQLLEELLAEARMMYYTYLFAAICLALAFGAFIYYHLYTAAVVVVPFEVGNMASVFCWRHRVKKAEQVLGIRNEVR